MMHKLFHVMWIQIISSNLKNSVPVLKVQSIKEMEKSFRKIYLVTRPGSGITVTKVTPAVIFIARQHTAADARY